MKGKVAVVCLKTVNNYEFRRKVMQKKLIALSMCVALGLLMYLLFSRQGDLGFLHLLYTLNGIAIGQAILVTPIIITFTANASASGSSFAVK